MVTATVPTSRSDPVPLGCRVRLLLVTAVGGARPAEALAPNSNAQFFADAIPRMRSSIETIDHYWSVEDQLYGWIDLWHRYPDRVDIVLIGHTVSGPVKPGVEPLGEPMYMARVWGADRSEHGLVLGDVHTDELVGGMAAYEIGAAAAASPVLPSSTINVVINASGPWERMTFPNPLTPREYIRLSRRGYGLCGPEWDWEFLPVNSEQDARFLWIAAVRPTSSVTEVVFELLRALSPDRLVATHNAKWDRWFMPCDPDNLGLIKATSTRLRQYFGPPLPFNFDAPSRRGRGFDDGQFGSVSYFAEPDYAIPWDHPKDRFGRTRFDGKWQSGLQAGGLAAALGVVTRGTGAASTLEMPTFAIKRLRRDGERTTQEAFEAGEQRLRRIMLPLLDELEHGARAATGFDADAVCAWLADMQWVRGTQPSTKITSIVPKIRHAPATGIEDFCLDARRAFLVLCRLGQAQRLVPKTSTLYWRIDKTIDDELRSLEEEHGLDPVDPALATNAYADFILTNLFFETRRTFDLGPVPTNSTLEMSMQ
jgi:hypothetical protein